MSPTGGFRHEHGQVSDAVDLSWKIDAVLKGWGGLALFDAYTIERRPVAVRNATTSSENLQRMLSPGLMPLLLDDTPEGAAFREEVRRGVQRRDAPRVAYDRDSTRLPVRRLTGVRVRRNAGPADADPDLRTNLASRRARAARVAARRPFDASDCRSSSLAAASSCCDPIRSPMQGRSKPPRANSTFRSKP